MTNFIMSPKPDMLSKFLNLHAIVNGHQAVEEYILIFFFLAYFRPDA